MGVLFARAFTQQNLLDAWEQVRDAALADGRPDRQVDTFEVAAARRVVELSAALGEGQWRPSAAYRVEIPKPSGGVRTLSIPPLADRVVERALPIRHCCRGVSPTAGGWVRRTRWPH